MASNIAHSVSITCPIAGLATLKAAAILNLEANAYILHLPFAKGGIIKPTAAFGFGGLSSTKMGKAVGVGLSRTSWACA